MQIRYTGQNIEITPALRDYSEKKLQRLQNHMNKMMDVHLVFSIEKLNQIVESTLSIPGTQIHAHASSENMYESIDKMVDKLMRQLMKYKEKLTHHD